MSARVVPFPATDLDGNPVLGRERHPGIEIRPDPDPEFVQLRAVTRAGVLLYQGRFLRSLVEEYRPALLAMFVEFEAIQRRRRLCLVP